MSEPLLVARGVCRYYQSGSARLDVLRDCSLFVAAGEFVAIRGASGSGKSTLLHILGALDVPQRGDVTFAGQAVFPGERARRTYTSAFDMLSVHERRRIQLRRRAFGFVFQFYHLLPELSVLENVLLARMIDTGALGWLAQRRAAREDCLRILQRVGLGERLRHRPGQLSGGERQRVAIARALVRRPRILLADEPTGNLDGRTGGRLMELIRELHAGGQTIVMVTHDAAVAGHADRTLHLVDGALQGAEEPAVT